MKCVINEVITLRLRDTSEGVVLRADFTIASTALKAAVLCSL